jgi:hypothetical protein
MFTSCTEIPVGPAALLVAVVFVGPLPPMVARGRAGVKALRHAATRCRGLTAIDAGLAVDELALTTVTIRIGILRVIRRLRAAKASRDGCTQIGEDRVFENLAFSARTPFS